MRLLLFDVLFYEKYYIIHYILWSWFLRGEIVFIRAAIMSHGQITSLSCEFWCITEAAVLNVDVRRWFLALVVTPTGPTPD